MAKKEINYKLLAGILGAVIVIMVVVIIVNGTKSSGRIIDETSTDSFEEVKKVLEEPCPYECCPEGDYLLKTCAKDYECISYSCFPIDFDNDGLLDIDERQIGTNPQLVDTDGDTLGDYKEHKVMGTDPLNPNTDGDRYNDDEDLEPLNVNSAKINIEVVKNKKYYNEELKDKLLPILVCLSIHVGEISLGEVTGFIAQICQAFIGIESLSALSTSDISYRDIEIQTRNIGDDYTSYVKYKMNIYTKYENNPKEFFDSKEISIGPLDSREVYTDKRTYSFKIEDYTVKVLKNIFEGKIGDKEYIFEFENLDYERYG